MRGGRGLHEAYGSKYLPLDGYVRYYVHTMPKTVTATQARKDFFKLLEQASKPGHHVTISRQGQENIVVMSEEEFEGWIETLEVMSDPKLVKQLRDYEKEKKAGTLKTIPWSEVKKKLK